MSLFGGSVKSMDVGAFQRLAQDKANKRKSITQGLSTSLGALNPIYEQKRTDLAGTLVPQTEQRLTQLGTEAAGLGVKEREAANVASRGFREQAFRDTPDQQRAVRESLGGSGLLQSGAAASALARPTIDALRSSRDFETGQEAQLLDRQAGRDQDLVNTRFTERGATLEKKFGLDQGTMDYLQSIGREDLISEAESLSGIERDLGDDLMSAEMLNQQQRVAKSQAKNATRNAVIGGLGQLGGAGLGFLAGGPLGASLGAQAGGSLANLATGSPTSFDPTLLYAMSQRNKGAVQNSFRAPAGYAQARITG